MFMLISLEKQSAQLAVIRPDSSYQLCQGSGSRWPPEQQCGHILKLLQAPDLRHHITGRLTGIDEEYVLLSAINRSYHSKTQSTTNKTEHIAAASCKLSHHGYITVS